MERYSRRGPRKYFQRCCYFFFFSKSKIILSLNYPIIQLVFIVLLSPRSIQEWVRQIPTSWSLESSGEADSVRDMPFLCDHFCHVGLQCWLLLLTSMHACMPAKLLQSCLTLCDPMDCSPQALLSMGFSRQEYWSRLPFPPPGDLPNPRIKPASPGSPASAGRFFTTGAAKSLQSCSTLCDPIDGSPSGFPIPGILQARTLEWVAISFSNAWKWKVKVKSLSCVRLFATSWTAAYQAPMSMGFSRQEYWSGVPLPSPSLPLAPPF